MGIQKGTGRVNLEGQTTGCPITSRTGLPDRANGHALDTHSEKPRNVSLPVGPDDDSIVLRDHLPVKGIIEISIQASAAWALGFPAREGL